MMNTTTTFLRALADHIDKHQLAGLLSAKPDSVLLYANAMAGQSAIELLLAWAATLNAVDTVHVHQVTDHRQVADHHHLTVVGDLPCGTELGVTIVAQAGESAALRAELGPNFDDAVPVDRLAAFLPKTSTVDGSAAGR